MSPSSQAFDSFSRGVTEEVLSRVTGGEVALHWEGRSVGVKERGRDERNHGKEMGRETKQGMECGSVGGRVWVSMAGVISRRKASLFGTVLLQKSVSCK